MERDWWIPQLYYIRHAYVRSYRRRHFRLNSTWESFVLLLFPIFFVSNLCVCVRSVSTSASTAFCFESYVGVSMCMSVCVCRRSVYITQSHRLLYDGGLNMPANCAIIPIWYREMHYIRLSARSRRSWIVMCSIRMLMLLHFVFVFYIPFRI